MNGKLPSFFVLSTEVLRARSLDLPLVALESTVITQGLPYPQNLDLAKDMENVVRSQGAVPATIAVLDGKIHAGVNEKQLERLAKPGGLHKVSSRDFAAALAKDYTGGTTVAGTLVAAHILGIRVFATGGIGGVHRQAAYDVSSDLTQLARTPMIVVCAGAKAILDLPATLEMLETLGVPVVGYQSDDFPAFYSRSSGLKASTRADSPQEVVKIARAHWDLGLKSAILVAQPPPEEVALPNEVVEHAIQKALEELRQKNIHGQEVTPFLLDKVNKFTGEASLRANLALLLNNARLAAEIARYIVQSYRQKIL